MSSSRRPIFIAAVAMAVAAIAALLACAKKSTAPEPEPVHPADHVVVVVLENSDYDTVRVLPYIRSLIASGTVLDSSYALRHPSQPNYLALWSGSMQGVTDDRCPAPGSPFLAENLGHALEAEGRSWRAYVEGLPVSGSPECSAGNAPHTYSRKHAPWTHFANVDHQNERPYSEMATDMNLHRLPDLAFVIPDNCHSAHEHSCSDSLADVWLSHNLPAMIATVGPRGMVVLTWDEDGGRGHSNHILTVLAGGAVKSGSVSLRRVNHYTVLRLICDALGVPPFAAARDSAAAMPEVWR